MFCGMYETIITPSLGMRIPGDFLPSVGQKVDDDLYVKAAYFDDGQNTFLILAFDTVGIMRPTVLKIRDAAAQACGLDPQSVMVCCTHDHSGGPANEFPPMNPEEPEYISLLLSRCRLAAGMARENRQPVLIGYGLDQEDKVSFNRRYWFKDGKIHTYPGFDNPDRLAVEGGIDPDVAVIRIDDLRGNPVGVISNFACHVTAHIQHGVTEAFSADYPGQIAQVIKQQLGPNVVSLFLTGACGNVTQVDWEERVFTRDQIFGDSHHKTLGRILAFDILRAREFAVPVPVDNLKTASSILALECRIPNEEAYSQAKVYLREHPVGSAVSRDEHVEEFYAVSAVHLYEGQPTLPAEIQVVLLGDIAIASFPAEMFCELGLELKKSLPQKLLISTLSNGDIGYIPTEQAMKNGGYEGKIGFTSCAGIHSGQQMIEESARLIRQLAAQI